MPSRYVDPRVERERWRLERADVEARWMVGVLARLAKGPALTSDLAEACAVEPGSQYSRFTLMLKRRTDVLRKGGQQLGKTGHQNNVWEKV